MPDGEPLYVGIDFGTTGVRVSIIDDTGNERAYAKDVYADFGLNYRSPTVWWSAFENAFCAALGQVDRGDIIALAIDGTSGTVLPVSKTGKALADASLYNDACTDPEITGLIERLAPVNSAARGATSALARALFFAKNMHNTKVLHQADWIGFRFSGRFVSDENNALKMGYDPEHKCWPDWIAQTGLDLGILPEVVPAGTVISRITQSAAVHFALPGHVQIIAGTTDGCAAFLATGASEIGDGVTSLGTTLTIKILSNRPIFAANYGVYSHHILGLWLAGGASNSGGNVLEKYFCGEDLAILSEQIKPTEATGLKYYPLSKPGERFPISDAGLQPVMLPVPDSRAIFLQGILEGISAIEALAYQRLAELGAPVLKSLRTVGAGAANHQWAKLREAFLPAAFKPALSTEASYGTALLARAGCRNV